MEEEAGRHKFFQELQNSEWISDAAKTEISSHMAAHLGFRLTAEYLSGRITAEEYENRMKEE